MMIGTDHTLAPVEVRSKLFLTKERRAGVMRRIMEYLGAEGLVILQTCNRMELWVSLDDSRATALYDPVEGVEEEASPLLFALCYEMGLDPYEFVRYFIERPDEEAVQHLFFLSCGLKSAIMAEDQIVSQVKQAISFSRHAGLADGCLEVLFRTAVTAAKKVKSNVRFTRADTTAVDSALSRIEKDGFDVAGKTCMVIGNGEYGRLAATTLLEHGARVMMTVRQYHHGRVRVPPGCEAVSYGDRYEVLQSCDLVMSATTSPHFTLLPEELPASWPPRPIVLVDLAVPRDIDPALGDREGVTLYDIDCFQTGYDSANDEALRRATAILYEEIEVFWNWLARRDMIDGVAALRAHAEDDMHIRMKNKIDRLPLTRGQRDELLADIEATCGRVVSKALYEMLEHAASREDFVDDVVKTGDHYDVP